MGTVLPALAPHVRRDLGGSDHTVGFVIGIFSVVALVQPRDLRAYGGWPRPQSRLSRRTRQLHPRWSHLSAAASD